MTSTSQSACVRFRLGRQGFGLPLEQVREIVAAGVITPVPLAPAVIRGLANLRGRVVTLIDVATVFGRSLPPASGPEERLALILGAPWDHLGLYVHAPVEIGEATAAGTGGGQAVTAVGVTAAAGTAVAHAEGAADETAGAPALGLATVSGDFVHIVSARELVAYCEARVLEGFRKRS